MESEGELKNYRQSNKLHDLVSGSNIQKMILSYLIYPYNILSLVRIGP